MNTWKKTFTIIWTGQIFSTLSSMTVGYALIFWLSFETKSAEVLALATIFTLLPQLVLGPFIGVLIDRLDRRSVMVMADLFIAICSAVIAYLFSQGNSQIHLLYLLMMLRSIGSAFHLPAMQASVPLLAPESELMRISGVNQMIQSGSIIAGPPLAALLINSMDMSAILLLDVAGAFIASASLLMVEIPNPVKSEQAPAPHILREMKEGFLEISGRRGLFVLFMVSVAVTFFIMPIATLFPLMTINHFEGSTFQVSIIEAGWGTGALIGGMILGFKKFNFNKIVLINTMYLLLGLVFALSGILPENGFRIFLVLTALGGIIMSVQTGTFMVVLQTAIEPSALGRVFSIYGSLNLLPSIVGLMFTGYIAERIGVPNTFLIAGVTIAFLGSYSFLSKALKEMSVTES